MNIHPPLTSFPVAFLLAALAAEFSSYFFAHHALRRFARWQLGLGVIAAILCYFSGYIGAAYANQTFTVSTELIAQHQATARLLLFSLVPTSILALTEVEEEGLLRWIYLSFLTLSCAILCYTAYQGGQLVFRFGAGVGLDASVLEGK